MFERQDLLDSDLPSRGYMPRRSDGSVRPFSEAMKDFVVLTYSRRSWKLGTGSTNRSLSCPPTSKFGNGLFLREDMALNCGVLRYEREKVREKEEYIRNEVERKIDVKCH